MCSIKYTYKLSPVYFTWRLCAQQMTYMHQFKLSIKKVPYDTALTCSVSYDYILNLAGILLRALNEASFASAL